VVVVVVEVVVVVVVEVVVVMTAARIREQANRATVRANDLVLLEDFREPRVQAL
jgi:hypothetical protein